MAIHHVDFTPDLTTEVLALASQERARSLSVREWKHRFAGYGYAIHETDHGPFITSLHNHIEICAVPTDLLH